MKVLALTVPKPTWWEMGIGGGTTIMFPNKALFIISMSLLVPVVIGGITGDNDEELTPAME
jgi:hypothetical protein